jgi:cell division protein FtsN
LNYNILREQYRYAIGQDVLLSELKVVSDEKSGEESTEVFEGITYSVKVGVFGERKNAERMADQIEGYGYKSRIERRKISENYYHVVLAGRFTTMKEAQAARQRLEQGENMVFQVVVNDEK